MGNSLLPFLDVHSSLAVQCLYAVFYLTMHIRKNTLVQLLPLRNCTVSLSLPRRRAQFSSIVPV